MPTEASASVHYFRIPAAGWGAVLDRLAGAGFEAIDLYVPWGVHEQEGGAFDFGEKRPDLDLRRFLGLVESRGLGAILRPGPSVNAELPNFGLPDRIVRHQGVQALSPSGRPVLCPFIPDPFPVPSYASTLYLEETAKWFRQVGSVAGDFLRKKGFVRMVQVDNEASLFFRDGPFDQDYRSEAVELYRTWLADQGIEPRDPPTDREPGIEGLRHGLLWMRFRQWMMVSSLKKMRRMLEEAGFEGAPFSHNVPPAGLLSPVPPAMLRDAVDVVTTDVYATAADSRMAMHQVRLVAALEERPTAGEMGSGAVFYSPYVTAFDNKVVLLASLACGLGGFNIYMGTERDRWIGGLVSESGEVERTSLLHFYQRLLMLAEAMDLGAFRPLAPAAVILPREYVDHTLLMFPFHGLSPALVSGFGMNLAVMLAGDESALGTSVQTRWLERLDEIFAALRRASLFYSLVDTGGEGDIPPGPCDVILVPTFVYLGPKVIRAMVERAEGGTPVIAGPGKPNLDSLLRPLDPGLRGRMEACVEAGTMRFVENLGEEGGPAPELERIRLEGEAALPFTLRKKNIETELVVHAHPSRQQWLVYVLHLAAAASTTLLEVEKGWVCERVIHLAEGNESGEFSRTKIGKDRVVALDHGGIEVSVLHLAKKGSGESRKT